LRALKRNPLECWSQEHFEQPIVSAALPIGRVLVVNEPTAIRHVLLDNAANYQKDTLQRRVLSAGLGDGLLSAEGERWRIQRRTLAPLFAKRTVSSFAPAMLDAATALMERWKKRDGATIDIAAEMTRLTLDVLVRTIFSEGLGRDPEEFRAAMAVYFNTIGRIGPLDLLGAPPYVPRLAQLRVRSTLRFFEDAITEIIATRRQRLADNREHLANDILTLLLAALDPVTGERMTEAEVRSNILTFISAGHETTANALTWSLFLISKSPEWRQSVEAEVEAVPRSESLETDALTETRAVIEEAIRLYPPIAAISRSALDADTIAGERIESGTMVVIAPYVLHRHRSLWTAPDEFDPSRFLGEARNKIDRFAYLPFGAGPRTCIGSTFALQEATLVLATIARNFRLSVADETSVQPTLRVTLRPAGGLRMVVTTKRPTAKPDQISASAA
jgi:cytochrome P450